MIRPFQLGDVLLLQRLQRQSTKLNVVQALLQPRSPSWAALTAVKPWDNTKVMTCVLHQNGHGLARAGVLQAQRRPNRDEADILMLAPALDTRTGHPAIWEKLLAYYVHEATQHQIMRLYADVPDQPLLVNTFGQVGFSVYARQTVWRLLDDERAALPEPARGVVRPLSRSDEWELLRLYNSTTPRAVQVADGAIGEQALNPPILDWWYGGDAHSYVYVERGLIEGCVRVVSGKTGIWMQLWADTRRPDVEVLRALVCGGVSAARARMRKLPVYVAVKEYQGGLGSMLGDVGFAPFADHAKMVKHLVQRVVEFESVRKSAVETVPEALVTVMPLPRSSDPARPQHAARTHAPDRPGVRMRRVAGAHGPLLHLSDGTDMGGGASQ